MGMPAKKKAAVVQDDRKPRINTFSAFVCAQPYDDSPYDLVRGAKACQLGVRSVDSVHSIRSKFKHLRFLRGESPSAFVFEYLEGDAPQKAKAYTASNSRISIEVPAAPTIGSGRPVNSVSDIAAVVDRVLGTTKEPPTPAAASSAAAAGAPVVDPEALWGRRADGTPRRKSGPKSKNSLSVRERMVVEERQTVIDTSAPQQESKQAPVEEGGGELRRLHARHVEPAIADVTPAIVTEPPAPEAAVEQQLIDEDDDVILQELRDGFNVGDIVHVSQPTRNGTTLVREGRITGKERSRAAVAMGTVVDKIPYKRLSLAPPMSGRGTAHANSNGDIQIRQLKVVPKAFERLRTAPIPEPVAPPPAPPSPPPPPPIKVEEPAPVAAPPVPEVKPAAGPVAAPQAAIPQNISQQHKDLLTWLEMGAAFGEILPGAEAALRAEADCLTQEIARLTAEREVKLKQADTIAIQIRLMTQVGAK
jgi:hypothetical protein